MGARRRLQDASYDCRDEQQAIEACSSSLEASALAVQSQLALCSEEMAAAPTSQSIFAECELATAAYASFNATQATCLALPLPCSGRGDCGGETGLCNCTADGGWRGSRCAAPAKLSSRKMNAGRG